MSDTPGLLVDSDGDRGLYAFGLSGGPLANTFFAMGGPFWSIPKIDLICRVDIPPVYLVIPTPTCSERPLWSSKSSKNQEVVGLSKLSLAPINFLDCSISEGFIVFTARSISNCVVNLLEIVLSPFGIVGKTQQQTRLVYPW